MNIVTLMRLLCVFDPGTMDPPCPPSSGWSAASSPTRWTLASASTGWRSRGRKPAGWSTCTLWACKESRVRLFWKSRGGKGDNNYAIFFYYRQKSWMTTRGWSVLWIIISYRKMEAGSRCVGWKSADLSCGQLLFCNNTLVKNVYPRLWNLMFLLSAGCSPL